MTLSTEDRVVLGAAADLAIAWLYEQWEHTKKNRREPKHDGDVLGWMRTDDYLALAAKSMQSQVIAPLEAHDIPIKAQVPASLRT